MSNTKKQGLVERIMSVLGLDEAGKLQKFFDREKKSLAKKINSLETNKKVDKMNYDNELSELHDNLEDAMDQYEDAKLAITPEDIKTNADMDNYSVIYWETLADRKASVEFIETAIERLENELKTTNEIVDDQIADCKDKLSIIDEVK